MHHREVRMSPNCGSSAQFVFGLEPCSIVGSVNITNESHHGIRVHTAASVLIVKHLIRPLGLRASAPHSQLSTREGPLSGRPWLVVSYYVVYFQKRHKHDPSPKSRRSCLCECLRNSGRSLLLRHTQRKQTLPSAREK